MKNNDIKIPHGISIEEELSNILKEEIGEFECPHGNKHKTDCKVCKDNHEKIVNDAINILKDMKKLNDIHRS